MESLVLFVATFFAFISLLSILSFILMITLLLGRCLVIKKLGDKCWKGLIPFYGTYTMFKKTNTNDIYFCYYLLAFVLMIVANLLNTPFMAFILTLFASAIAIFSLYMMYSNMVKMFNISRDYIIGLILFDEIFLMLIGFNENIKIESQEKEEPVIDLPTTKICPKCGENIPTEALYCQYCGHDQSKKVRKKKTEETAK